MTQDGVLPSAAREYEYPHLSGARQIRPAAKRQCVRCADYCVASIYASLVLLHAMRRRTIADRCLRIGIIKRDGRWEQVVLRDFFERHVISSMCLVSKRNSILHSGFLFDECELRFLFDASKAMNSGCVRRMRK